MLFYDPENYCHCVVYLLVGNSFRLSLRNMILMAWLLTPQGCTDGLSSLIEGARNSKTYVYILEEVSLLVGAREALESCWMLQKNFQNLRKNGTIVHEVRDCRIFPMFHEFCSELLEDWQNHKNINQKFKTLVGNYRWLRVACNTMNNCSETPVNEHLFWVSVTWSHVTIGGNNQSFCLWFEK